MRNWMLLSGFSAAVALSAWACGSDVDTVPSDGGGGGDTTTTTSGTGGAGGVGTTSVSTTSSTTSGAGGFANLCEEACDKLETECGAQGACGAFQSFLGVSCGEPDAECPAQCALDATCVQLFSLLGQNPDPTLTACLEDCGVADPCQTCLISDCGAQLQDCGTDATCSDFLMCAQACNDEACLTGCAADHPSAATTALLTCIDTNCSDECTGGAGGAGGSGGSGGAGGSGGN